MSHLHTDDPALGSYYRPQGYLDYYESLPFLGSLSCNLTTLEAGSWQEIVLDYQVGGSGIADGAWMKVTFKFYSDWALFQTEDPLQANYVSAEYQTRDCLPGESAATVQSLQVRFDQKGHERPYQKAIIVDVVDGYLKPGDHILIRLGDRRAGGPGTRIQTFVEEGFRLRAYLDPVGTSRFAAIPGDVVLDIVPGSPHNLELITPRLVKAGQPCPVRVRVEDRWGNACWNLGGGIRLRVGEVDHELEVPTQGWAVGQTVLTLQEDSLLQAFLTGSPLFSQLTPVSVEAQLAYPRAFFGDLHVHSNNTIGTNSTEYNFSYGRDVAGLDVLGYTANDFNITQERWLKDVELCRAVTQEGSFLCYPGTEWCGNSAAGGDRNVVFLGDEVLFPTGRDGETVRSFEWNEDMKGVELQPGAWPVSRMFAAYAHDPENHLLIPHVGGRRAILDWHHPRLERLIEVGSAWGHFPWFFQEAIQRGYKLGASASGDEHLGRCGGGVPGTAVFGVKGGLTGILSPSLTKRDVNKALRARHTWATTGERLVALLWSGDPDHIQGDELRVSEPVTLHYRLLGDQGWDQVAAFTDQGLLWQRNLHQEAGYSPTRIRLRWGGARIRDRYRWAEWQGSLSWQQTLVQGYRVYGLEHPEEYVRRSGPLSLEWRTSTFGDADAVELNLSDLASARFKLHVKLGGYVKVGSVLKPNPFLHCPEFSWEFSGSELLQQGSLVRELGGAELFMAVERLSGDPLPRDVQGHFVVEPQATRHSFLPVYVFGRQRDDAKAWTSPLFVEFGD